MSARIPPSLKWLIDKRARLTGKIAAAEKAIRKKTCVEKRLSKYLDNIAVLEKELPKLQEDLAGIDRALTLHDIQVNVEYIHPISPRSAKIQLPYGVLTQTLLAFLRLSQGEPLSTDALTIMLMKRFTHLQGETEQDFHKLRKSVRHRLKSLANDQIIVRAPNTSSRETRWALPTASHHA